MIVIATTPPPCPTSSDNTILYASLTKLVVKVVFVGIGDDDATIILLTSDFLNNFFAHQYKIIASKGGLTHHLKA